MNVEAFAELNKKRDRIRVEFPYDREAVKAIRNVPGAKFEPPNRGGPCWLLPLDLTSAQLLREGFGDKLTLGDAVKKWGHRQVRKQKRLADLASASDAKLEFLPKSNPKLAKALRPYQRADVAKMAAADTINANVPGLGKTIESIAAVYESQQDHGQVIVAAPKTSLEPVWLAELDKWLPEDVPVFLMSGDDSQRERVEIMDEIQEHHDNDEPCWLVTTPHMVRFKVDKEATKKNKEAGILDAKGNVKKVYHPAYPEIFEMEWNVAIWDEYHKMGLSNPSRDSDGTPSTMLAKAAFELIVSDRKWLLSGTPMGGKPIKLWAALSFIDPGRFTSMWRWVDEWLQTETKVIGYDSQKGEEKTATSYSDVRPDLQERFNEHIAPYMVRRTKKEVAPDLPDKQFVHLEVEMTKQQKKQYDKMAQDAEVKIEAENLSATNILTEYMRLKQFADAKQTIETKKVEVKDPSTGDMTKVDKLVLKPTDDSGKLPMVLELLNERGIYTEHQIKREGQDAEGDSQIIIGSQFSKVADMVHEWLLKQGIACKKLTGATKQSDRTEMVRGFQAGEFRVIVMSTQAGGVAITLDKADTCIMLDETWDPDDQSQFSDRGWGRKLDDQADERNKMTVYFIRSKGTIEAYIWNMTRGKQITNDTILDLRRAGFRALMDEEELDKIEDKVAV